jgi:hypothetical protein
VPTKGDPRLPVRLAWWTAWAALTELIVLRITTRTLIHIPGLAAFEGPIRAVSEIGRLAYYVTVVLLIGLLVRLVPVGIRAGSAWSALSPVGMAMLFLSAAAGRVGLIGGTDLGWLTLVAILVVGAGVASTGWRTLPLLLLVAATWATGLAATLQGSGGGLSGETYGGLLRFGEIVAVGGCLLLPMVLAKPLSRRAWIVGLGTALVVTAMLTVASPTLTILVLWSFGLPASLPAIVYGLAAGSFSAVLVAAIQDGRRGLAAGLLLALAGGVGLVSTYQTALLVAGLHAATLHITLPTRRVRPSSQSALPEEKEVASLQPPTTPHRFGPQGKGPNQIGTLCPNSGKV